MLLKITFLLFLARTSLPADVLSFKELLKLHDGLTIDGDKCDFLCPRDVKPKPDPKFEPIQDGCLADGINVAKYVEDFPKFNDCCNVHDTCYQTCNKNRDACDTTLKLCMIDFCDRTTKYGSDRNDDCRLMATKIYSRYNGTACLNYQDAQRHACLCSGKKLSKDKLNQMIKEKKRKQAEKKEESMKAFQKMDKNARVEL